MSERERERKREREREEAAAEGVVRASHVPAPLWCGQTLCCSSEYNRVSSGAVRARHGGSASGRSRTPGS